MMKQMTLVSMCMLALATNACMAQSDLRLRTNKDGTFSVPGSDVHIQSNRDGTYSYPGLEWPPNQPEIPVEATNWGRPVQGIQILIYTTNTVVEPGSSIEVLGVITNASTNHIRYLDQTAAMNFDLTLRNASGKSYYLTPQLPTGNRIGGLNAGRQIRMIIPVSFWKSIEPGDYVLIATRNFSSIAGDFKMESNPLRIRIMNR